MSKSVPHSDRGGDSDLEVSVILPCLNEAETIATTVTKSCSALSASRIRGEVVVADNGSSDGSPEIARKHGARVVSVHALGYGNALMGGIAEARGQYVVMADADDSYDLLDVPRFVEKLREGYDLVQGCRMPSGGGTVKPGAMPLLHRVWGNPMFSLMARIWFRTPIHDINCGMRGFRRAFFHTLDQRCTGMEFAPEMIIKATLYGARIAEIPITLHPDGRKAHAPHLRTFRDGWRTLRFYLVYSPRWLFLIPGIALILAGLLGYAIALPGATVAGVRFDVHTLLFASLALIAGFQALVFGVLAKVFAATEGLLPADHRLVRISKLVSVEGGLIASLSIGLVGLMLLMSVVGQWLDVDLGDLNYAYSMRWAIPGVTLTTLGFQGVLASFYFGLLSLGRK